MSVPSVSLIIPTFNEMLSGYLKKNLEEHSEKYKNSIICVDGGSTDGTQDLIKKYPVTLILSPNKNRAERLNIGITQSQSDWVVIIHPRTFLPNQSLQRIFDLNPNINSWGAWSHSFDYNHFLLQFTSWYSNKIRGDRRSIFYLDHCLFIHRRFLLNQCGELIPSIPIFEDTEFSYILRNKKPGIRLSEKVVTSSVRFRKNGIYKQSIMNQLLKFWYLLKFDLNQINHIYEKGLKLNGNDKVSYD